MTYKPPFTLDDKTLSLVADIAQKVGQVEAYDKLSSSPQLRKENRIRTIHSSLAIESNSLSLDQVTAVIEGKHVVAPARDILEVQNALLAYESLDKIDPVSIESLLDAHSILMKGLTPEAGRFRSGGVGVFNGEKLIHAGTPPQYLSEVMNNLFDWLASSQTHPLIASCVFHYEFEFIHPFADGNGRMGRLWQTAILRKWNPLFEWLPMESLIKENQQEYYDALGESDRNANCTGFVQFMLEIIASALDDVVVPQSKDGINVGINVGITNEAEAARLKLLEIVKANPSITVAQMAAELGMSKRQAERIVSELKKQGKLVRIGANRNGRWEVDTD